MKTASFLRRFLLLPALLLAGLAAPAADVTWSIVIVPSGGGKVSWTTSAPAANGELLKSGKVKFNSGGLIDLTFTAQPGWALTFVRKNLDDWTPFLDANKHYQFGPVSKAHVIIASFTLLTPEGTFPLAFPTANGAIPPIVDPTGTYTGFSTTAGHRPFNVAVAMDEAGKVSYMGSVGGYVPKGGGLLSGSVGSVKTVSGQPAANLVTTFDGTRDGAAAKGKATAAGPVVMKDLGGGLKGAEANVGYSAVAGGVAVRDRNVPAQQPIDVASQSNVRKAWTLTLDLHKKTDTKGRSYIAANAQVALPGGDIVVFPEKRVKYTATGGYSIKLSRGTNISLPTPAIDKRTKLGVTRMKLLPNGALWKPTAGTLSYAFLGQKGQGDLIAFLP